MKRLNEIRAPKSKKEKRIVNKQKKAAIRKATKEALAGSDGYMKSIKKGIDPETGEVCCPRCGSGQISANRKGETLFTGVIGSKNVFITCLACGRRWRAGRL